MGDVLCSLGGTHASERDRAGFSGMSSQRELFLSRVVPRSFVEADEAGTAAAAAAGTPPRDSHAQGWTGLSFHGN